MTFSRLDARCLIKVAALLLAPISVFGESPFILLARPGMKIGSLQELVNAAVRRATSAPRYASIRR